MKRVGYIIVSSDRGLAGGLNNNLFRKLLGEIRKWQEQGVEVDVVTIGQKASRVLPPHQGRACWPRSRTWATQPRVEQLVGVIKVMLDAYSAGAVDKVFLAYNDFVNTMTQRAAFDQLLPLAASDTRGRAPRLGLPLRTRCRRPCSSTC